MFLMLHFLGCFLYNEKINGLRIPIYLTLQVSFYEARGGAIALSTSEFVEVYKEMRLFSLIVTRLTLAKPSLELEVLTFIGLGLKD